jgi:hypothetical protein
MRNVVFIPTNMYEKGAGSNDIYTGGAGGAGERERLVTPVACVTSA